MVGRMILRLRRKVIERFQHDCFSNNHILDNNLLCTKTIVQRHNTIRRLSFVKHILEHWAKGYTRGRAQAQWRSGGNMRDLVVDIPRDLLAFPGLDRETTCTRVL